MLPFHRINFLFELMIHKQLMSVVFMEIANDLYHWKIRDIDVKTLINVFNSTCCLRKKKSSFSS